MLFINSIIINAMKIGKIDIENPIVLAPMEDVTDTPFRLICRRMGADIVYTEFTSSEALIRGIEKAEAKIRILDEERPVAIQIFGAVEESMAQAARLAEQQNPDFIDINCGCWSKTHAARGECAGLLRDLPLLERIVRATVKATSLPVTVKTRLGWDQDSIVILEAVKRIENAGAQAVTVHCRTRSQGYKGQADWSWLEKIKKETNIPIIGNGDVLTPQDAKQMLETGCAGVMIGRGAVANPWIFKQTKHYLKTGKLLPPASIQDRVDLCVEHLKLSIERRGPFYGPLTFKKYYAGYLKGLPYAARLRGELMQFSDEERIVNRLNEYAKQLLDMQSNDDAPFSRSLA